MSKHIYNVKPDKGDARDFKFVRPSYTANPDSVDLRSTCSPVRDQGQLGSCIGYGNVTGMREFLENKAAPVPPAPPVPVPPVPPTPVPVPVPPVVPPAPPSPLTPQSALAWVIAVLQWVLSTFFATKMMKAVSGFVVLSPLMGYYNARALEGTTSQDAGAEVRDGLKALQQTGVCPESDWPYIISKFAKKPTAIAFTDAAQYKIASYTRLSTLADVQTCLAGGNGVVIGFDVYESFESDAVAATGRVPMPLPGEQLLGGHCVFVCGYKKDASWAGGGYLIVKNSWGVDWGDKGYFYLPWAYVTAGYVSDMWTAAL